MSTYPLVILDRDGVINHDSPDFIKSPAEWIPYPESLEALRLLHQAGIKVAVASNQSGIGRGLFSEETLNGIHHKMMSAVEAAGGQIDRIFYCPHLPDARCLCRKPQPGLLLQIQSHYQVNLTQIPVIGDSWRDLEAAIAVNAIPVLVKTGNGEKTWVSHQADLKNIDVFDSLLHAAQALLKK
ncbi:MAG: D-glycero-beta-D-manno-heptose 1,7-bisphosphate 7-phosphatase [Gammaproteobacteria bacterium]